MSSILLKGEGEMKGFLDLFEFWLSSSIILVYIPLLSILKALMTFSFEYWSLSEVSFILKLLVLIS